MTAQAGDIMARLTRLRPRAVQLASSRCFNPETSLAVVDTGIMDGISGLGLLSVQETPCLPGVEWHPRNLSDGMLSATDSYTRPRTTPCTAIATRPVRTARPGGGKTHRRSMDPSSEFRRRDYLWDRCRPGRRRRRRFDGISRRISRRRGR